MQKTKKAKKETYYQRWLRGKKKMTIIIREEEYETIKQFCDANKISYREFFTTIAPNLLRENKELKGQINGLTEKYNSLVEKYNALVEKYKQLKGEHEEIAQEYENLLNQYNQLKAQLSRVSNEYNDTKVKLQSTEEQLRKANEELKELKEILDIVLKGHVEVDLQYCEKLRPYGFREVEKEVSVGFMKKSVVSVCVNS